MITRDVIQSAGDYSKYITGQDKSQTAVEYYADKEVPSAWHGHSADIAGLKGPVTTESLEKVLSGQVREYNRESGEWGTKTLGRTRVDGETGERLTEHRAGYDFTFSPDKSLSVAAGVFGSEAALQAHNDAVRSVMQFVEANLAHARVNGESVLTGNLLYATFDHVTSRAADAQIHTHVVLSNITHHQGKAYSLDSTPIFKFTRSALDQLYNATLAHNLERAGIETVRDEKGVTKIAQLADVDLSVFSKRNEQIKSELAERGLDKDKASYEQRQIANLESRPDKNHRENADVHRERWQGEAKAAGIPIFKEPEPGTWHRQSEAAGLQAAHEALNAAKTHLGEKEQVFRMRDLLAQAARFSDGGASISHLEKALEQQMRAGDISQQDNGGAKGMGAAYITTKEAIRDNQAIVKTIQETRGIHRAIMSEKEFDKALEKFETRKTKEIQDEMRAAGKPREEVAAARFQLSGEQQNAAKMILTTTDGISMVNGLAGTGKTTFAAFVKEAAEQQGVRIIAVSSGGAQAAKLGSEIGIQDRTEAKLIKEFERENRDARLAAGALESFERVGASREYKSLAKGLADKIKAGAVEKHFDSAGRMYLEDKKTGRIYNSALSAATDPARSRTIESRNINHLGLTKTRYVVSNRGVFKAGGTLTSEFAGVISDQLRKHRTGVRAIDFVARKIVSHFENWQKASFLEAATVRAMAALESRGETKDILKGLRDQADLGKQRTLFIGDEISLSGAKDIRAIFEGVQVRGAQWVGFGDVGQKEKGDVGQIQSVSAGRAGDLISQHVSSKAELSQINRQKTDAAKEKVAGLLDTSKGRSRFGEAMRKNHVEIHEHRDKLKPGAGKSALADARAKDNELVRSRLAADFVKTAQQTVDLGQGQRKTQVIAITAGNADRNALNAEIRAGLKKAGLLGDGHEIQTVRGADRSASELAAARFFKAGETISFGTGNRSDGIKSGNIGVVKSINGKTNTLNVMLDDGKMRTINPANYKSLQVLQESPAKIEFSAGDRITFTKNDATLGVKNGQFATIDRFDGKTMDLTLAETNKKLSIDVITYKFIDHGYAVTQHKAQGQTVDIALIHHNTESHGHGDRFTYVNETRARLKTVTYTQDIEKAAVQAGAKLEKTSATQIEPTREAQQPDKAEAQLANADRIIANVQVKEIGRDGQNERARTAAVIKELARDLSTAGPNAQAVSGTFADRLKINRATRAALKKAGLIAKTGVMVVGLEKLEKSRGGLAQAANFNRGEVIKFGIGLEKLGVKKGEFAEVVASNEAKNTVRVRFDDKRELEFSPAKIRSVEVFRQTKTELVSGDRVRINNQNAIVVVASKNDVTLRLGDGQTSKLDPSQRQPIAHSYAVRAGELAGNTTTALLYLNTDDKKSSEKAVMLAKASTGNRNVAVYTQNQDKAAAQANVRFAVPKAPTRDQSPQRER